jgi:hypothetical protein
LEIAWKSSSCPSGRFGRAQEQVPAFAQREVEQRQHPLLEVGFEIDQKVAAADQVHPREGRVLQQVLRRENDRLPQRLFDAIGIILHLEEALQALLADIDRDARGILPGARR